MKKRIIVIGGLSAGPSAAAKARREDENAEILLFEKTNNISYATCGIPYALSGVIADRDNLMVVEADLLRQRFNVDVHLQEEVLEIRPDAHEIRTNIATYSYDKLVYAAGASTFVPPVKNIDKAKNWSACRSIADYDHIMSDEVIGQAKHITVMGAGLIGVEVAENLREAGKEVTLIEGGSSILPMWESKFRTMAKQTLTAHGVHVITDTYVKEFVLDGDKISEVKIGEDDYLSTDFVIMSVGIRPNTGLLTAVGAEAIGNGAVKVNQYMESSLPDIYAAGDCASVVNVQTGEYDYFPLGTHSNKGGRAAGANATGASIAFKGAYKTAIVKVFENTLGRTGMGPDFMRQHDIAFATNLIVAGATPGYYPNAKDMIVETYYNPETGLILGCEAFGEYGVDKRIDVMSTAIFGKLSIDDLSQLDLAYAPPFSPAKDPVVVSSFVSSNVLEGKYQEIEVGEFMDTMATLPVGSYNLIDVRKPAEVKALGSIPNAVNVELDSLRDASLEGIDATLPTYVYCAKGLRGYLAYLQLRARGFNQLCNLSGGYYVWSKLQ